MSKRPWYKRYGGDFIVGTMRLTLEERGAYSICLDLIYDRGGPIPDDDKWLAKVCGVSVRKWRTLRARLIEADKIQAIDGTLNNKRATRELGATADDSAEQAEIGAKGGRKRAENRSKTSRKPAEKQPASNDFKEVALACQIPEARGQKEDAAATARARLLTEPAWKLASELAAIAGHDPNPQAWPPGWAGAPMRVQGWLNEGWPEAAIIAAATDAAKRKPPGSIKRVDYFEGAVVEEIARQSRPLPSIPTIQEAPHAQAVQRHPGGAYGASKDAWRIAVGKLSASVEEHDPGSDGGDTVISPVAAPGCR